MKYLVSLFIGIGSFFTSLFHGNTEQSTIQSKQNEIAVSSSTIHITTPHTSPLKPISLPSGYSDGFLSLYFSTDGKYVYDTEVNDFGVKITKPLADADPATFQYVPLAFSDVRIVSYYEKDAGHVWYQNQLVTTSPAADPQSFKVVADVGRDNHDQYAKDKNHVYFNGEVLVGADPSTFVYVQSAQGFDTKDINHEYLDGAIVK